MNWTIPYSKKNSKQYQQASRLGMTGKLLMAERLWGKVPISPSGYYPRFWK
jgi:hypothetical protein